MDYIACRNLNRESDTLHIAKGIIKSVRQLLDLVETWLRDRGCDDAELIGRVRGALRQIRHNDITYSEHHSGLFEVVVRLTEDKLAYEVIFNYTTIGELTYKPIDNEGKN